MTGAGGEIAAMIPAVEIAVTIPAAEVAVTAAAVAATVDQVATAHRLCVVRPMAMAAIIEEIGR
jgi:hypothetical protein